METYQEWTKNGGNADIGCIEKTRTDCKSKGETLKKIPGMNEKLHRTGENAEKYQEWTENDVGINGNLRRKRWKNEEWNEMWEW